MSTKKLKSLNKCLSFLLACVLVFSVFPLPMSYAMSTDNPGDEVDTLIETTVHVHSAEAVLSGARVTLGKNEPVFTDDSGNAIFNVKAGEYALSVSMDGYEEYAKSVTVSDESKSFDVDLSKPVATTYNFSVVTVDNQSIDATDIEVALDGNTLIADEAGIYSVTFEDKVQHKLTITPLGDTFSAKYKSINEEIDYTFAANTGHVYQLDLCEYEVTITGVKNEVAYCKYGKVFTYDVSNQISDKFELIYVSYPGAENQSVAADDTISFTVTGNAQVTFAYAHNVTFNFDSKMGSVTVDEESIESGAIVELKEGQSPRYSITPNAGYHIKSISGLGDETTGDFSSGITGNLGDETGAVSIVFEETTYDITVVLRNSDLKKGAATVSGTEYTNDPNGIKKQLSLAAETGEVTCDYKVGLKNYSADDDCYTLNINIESIADNYKLYYMGDYYDGKDSSEIVITGITSSCEKTITLEPINYKIEFVDPFSDTIESVTGNVESGKIALPIREAPVGYTFRGWSETVPDSFTSDNENIIKTYENGITENKILYAVYTIDGVTVGAESKAVCGDAVSAGYAPGNEGDKISSAWFSSDVRLSVTSPANAEVSISVDETPLLAGDNSVYTITAANAVDDGKQNVVISQKKVVEKNGTNFVYVSEANDAFTVCFDMQAPVIDVTSENTAAAGEYSNGITDTITASDGEKENGASGVAKVQYYAVKLSDDSIYTQLFGQNAEEMDSVKYKELIETVKENLRNEAWKDLSFEALQDGQSKVTSSNEYQFNKDENIYYVYRVVDAAGNDSYSSFDHTIPEITSVSWSYTDVNGTQNHKEGSVYSAGDVTVEMTVKDRRLAIVDNGFNYDGAVLKVYSKSTNDVIYTAKLKESAEKFSVFYDKWTCSFVIPFEELKTLEKLNMPLYFVIEAEDQVGNEAKSYVFPGGELVLVDAAPVITVSYDYTDNAAAHQAVAASENAIYSKDSITAHINVASSYFGVENANVVVTDSNGKTYDVDFEKNMDGWSGSVTLDDLNGGTLTVHAVSQVGIEADFTSKQLYVDKTAPEIHVEYTYYEKDTAPDAAEETKSSTVTDPDADIFNNSNLHAIGVSVHVTDDHLYPFGEKSATKYVIKVNGKELKDITWAKQDTSEWKSEIFDLPTADENLNVEIEAYDQAGNKGVYAFDKLHNDSEAPEICALNLELIAENKVLRMLTFGNFFNDKVVLTVAAKDFSGLESMLMYYSPEGADEQVITSKAPTEGDDGAKIYTFELPIDENEEVDFTAFSLSVCDQVGNQIEKTKIESSFENGKTNFKNSKLLYETEKPIIKTSIDTDDTNVLYTDSKTNKNWLLKDSAFAINVKDESTLFESVSGIYSVSVALNGEKLAEKSVNADESAVDAVTECAKTLEYDLFVEGENTVAITAEDNAGNVATETYTVYKDSTESAIKNINLTGTKGKSFVLEHGNYFSDDAVLTFDVADNGPSSGIKSVQAYYVTSGNETELTAQNAALATEPLADGSYETACTFGIPYADNTNGYILIRVTDYVGNVREFTKDSNIPEGSEIKANSVMFEKAVLTLACKASDPAYTKDGMSFYANNDIDYTITVSDIGDNMSGLASVNILLNGEKVQNYPKNESAAYKAVGEYTFNIKDITTTSAVEGKNVIAVEAVDNAGNTSNAEYTFYIDTTLPVVQSVSLELREQNAAGKILRMLTFGNFFNDKVVVTVNAKDFSDKTDDISGMKSIRLFYAPNGADEQEITDAKIADGTEGAKIYTFELPIPKNEDEKVEEVDFSAFSLSVCDQAGNATEKTKIEPNDKTNFSDSTLLYDYAEPIIKTPIGNKDTNVLYIDSSTNTNWLLDKKAFDIVVEDSVASSESGAGIYSVSVSLNGEKLADKSVEVDESADAAVPNHATAIEYDLFVEGENTVAIRAEDNAGNVATRTYTVYKDSAKSTVKNINLSGTEEKYSVLDHGNYFADNAVLTVDVVDNGPSSGIASVKAYYVTDAGKKTELAARDADTLTTAALADGTTETVCTFDIPYDDNTNGYISISVTDNVGNVYDFSKDSSIPESFGIKVNSVMFENAELTFDCAASDPAYTKDGMSFYANNDIDYTITVNDNGDNMSGLASVNILLNGVAIQNYPVDESAEYKTTGEYTFNIKDITTTSAVEGKNVITVEAVDNAGNTSEIEYTFYIDTTLPVVQSVSLSLSETSSFGKILRMLTFGNFFNDKVVVTVNAKDSSDKTDDISGMKSIRLFYAPNGADEQEITDAKIADGADGAKKYTFDLPISENEEVDSSAFSISVCDRVGNATEKTKVEPNDKTNFKNSKLLYETVKPVITASVDNNDGAQDTEVLYADSATGTNWLLDGKAFDIAVDESEESSVFNSGIYSVSVALNGEKLAEKSVDADESALTAVTEHATAIEYDLFVEGENTVSVRAEDNAGNVTESTYTVYKDSTKSTITKIDLSGTEGKYSVLDHGNYFADDAVLTVDIADNGPSSGIESVKAYYVTDDGNEAELSAQNAAALTTNALADGTNKTVCTFDIPYVDDTNGYVLIRVTDHVGNVHEFSKDSAIPEGSGIKINSVMFENVELIFDCTASDPAYTKDEMSFYANNDIDYTITVSDNGENMSGLASVDILLNGKSIWEDPINESAEYKVTGEYSFNISDISTTTAVEGENVITVKTVDNAGNTSESEYLFYIDTTKPVVQSITLSLREPGAAGKLMRLLTFGNFFNDTAVLTVGVKDDEKATSDVSGMKALTLILKDKNGEVIKTVVNTKPSIGIDGTSVYTFELPHKDGEMILSAWTSVLSITATDNVGNEISDAPISSFGKDVAEFDNSMVLYELSSPTVDTPINRKGGPDSEILYVDTVSETNWLRKDKDFDITVSDKSLTEGLNSGLYSVDITLNGKTLPNLPAIGHEEALYEYPIVIAYEDFAEGRNTVAVNAVDNAGNTLNEIFAVYKDSQTSSLTNISLTAKEGMYSVLSHGNYFSDDAVLTLDVLDAEYSSGVKSVMAYYVYDVNRIKLAERASDAPAASARARGDNKTVRTFDLPYTDNAIGYIEIVITDNVGNVFTFSENDEIPSTFDIKKNSVSFDRKSSAIVRTEKTSVPVYSNAAMDFYANNDINYEVTISDVSEQSSGIGSIVFTLNGVQVQSIAVNESGDYKTEKTYSFNIKDVIDTYGANAALEGRNVLGVKTIDNAGNISESEYVFYVDTISPVVQSIAMTLKDTGLAGKALTVLPFGNYFNDTVVLTVGIKDSDAVTSDVADMAALTLHYVDNTGEEAVKKSIENKGGKKTEGITYYSFEIPVPAENAKEELLTYWISNLSLSAIDNVGNTLAETPIDQFGKTVAAFDSNTVLFETKEPTIITSQDNNNGAQDKNVLYVDGETKTDWMLSEEAFVITVEDKTLPVGLNSGLNTVTVSRNGEVIDEYGFTVGNSEILTASHTVNFAYGNLVEGRNDITVDAVDNAGNRATKTYTVYKDIDAPEVTGISFTGKSGSNLPYGNFYSENMSVTLNLRDTENSSGIQYIDVSYITDNGEEIPLTERDPSSPETNALTSGENTITRIFDLTANNTTGYIQIIVTDNAGNSFTFGENSDIPSGSNIESTFLMMEKTLPEITETIPQPTFTCEDVSSEGAAPCGKNWYDTFDIPISIAADDVGSTVSGIRKIETTLNGVVVESCTSNETEVLTANASYSFNVKDVTDFDGAAVAKQGENIVTVTLYDNAGNSVKENYYIYVDVTNPVVESFTFAGKNGGADVQERCNTVTTTDYGYYFSADTTVTVHVADALPGSGISVVHFATVPVDTSIAQNTSESAEAATACALAIEGTEKNSSSASFLVKAGFKGQIYAYVTDNVGNMSVENTEDTLSWARPDGVILETQQQHDSREPHTSISLGSENFVRNLANGTPLYKDNVTVSVAVSDEYAGIKSIELSVKAPYDTGNNAEYPVAFNNDGSFERNNNSFIYTVGQDVAGWNISATDLNLVTKVDRVITVANNSNDIKVHIKMTDNSGNITEQETELNIDKDAPVVSVSFAPASEGDDSAYTGYFNKDRVMTVTVIERNFDPSLVSFVAKKTGANYAIGTNFSSAGQYAADAQRGIESYEYTLTHTFHDDGDYTFAMSAVDMASNTTEDSAVNYGAEVDRTVAKVFTIDETKPEIFIDISGERGRDEYYKGNVTLTVSVNEHNFAKNNGPQERYALVIDVRDSQSGNTVTTTLPGASYSEAGDKRTFVYEYSEEYRYHVTSVSVTDMAGNKTDVYTGSYTGGDFVVDQTAPVINFFKQDSVTPLNKIASQEEDFAPSIRFNDTNLAAGDASSYTISLIGNYNGADLAGTSDYTYSAVPNPSDPGELTVRFSAFPLKEDVDDIYTLNVSVTDKAGFVTTASSIFSVNRFGSTFMVSPETKSLVKKFYTNTEQDVKIIQINSAEVSNQSITLTRNNTLVDGIVEGQDYTIRANIPGDDTKTDSTWYEYEYTVKAENFVQEGAYNITVYSSDSAENTITSATTKRTVNLFKEIERIDSASTIDDTLETNVRFRVDKTKPFAFASNLDKTQYFSGSHTFTLNATDDVVLGSLTLKIDGENKYTKNLNPEENPELKNEIFQEFHADYELTDDSNDMQELVISAVDMAGNVYTPSDEEILHVQVTRNLFKWYQNNVIAQIISIVVLVAAVVLLVILIKRRKSKNAES